MAKQKREGPIPQATIKRCHSKIQMTFSKQTSRDLQRAFRLKGITFTYSYVHLTYTALSFDCVYCNGDAHASRAKQLPESLEDPSKVNKEDMSIILHGLSKFKFRYVNESPAERLKAVVLKIAKPDKSIAEIMEELNRACVLEARLGTKMTEVTGRCSKFEERREVGELGCIR